MLLSSLKRTSIGKDLLVDDDVVVLLVPSSDKQIWQSAYDTPFLLSRCKGIVVPNQIIKVNRKPVNGRIHYLDAKKQFLELKNGVKKIPVIGSLSPISTRDKEEGSKNPKQFYLYDTSLLMKGLSQWLDKLPEKKIFTILIDNLRNIYNKIKSEFPKKKVLLVTEITDKADLFYIFINNFKQLKNTLADVLSGGKFFDLFLFASVNKRLLPVIDFDEKNGVFVPIPQMIGRMNTYVDSSELADDIDGAPAIADQDTKDEQDTIVPNKSIVTKLVDALHDPSSLLKNTNRRDLVGGRLEPTKRPPKTKELSIKAKSDNDDIDKIKIELDGRTLSKVMRYFKVTNPDIVANVKAALDTYIKETGEVPTKANAEALVLKAVNRSIHGTDKVDEVYLANPNLLFEKLKDVNVYSVPLEFPKNQTEFPFDVSDVVTLKAVTGQHRQKYEFVNLIHENIEKVFKTLENQIHPIKVNKITYEYVDNNLDRFIEYTISLQNMTGNKQKYDVKLDIPTVLNDKYFKLGGNRYIFSSQQHFKPLTKTKKTRVRILTNYTTIELAVENMKFNVSDMNDIMNYIQQRYPNLISAADEKGAEFSDGDKIYYTGNQVVESLNTNIIIDPETNQLKNTQDPDQVLKYQRFEFLFDFVLTKIHNVNPEDNFN